MCTQCGGVAVADKWNMTFECPALHTEAAVCSFVSTDTDSMRSFFMKFMRDHATRSHATFQVCSKLS